MSANCELRLDERVSALELSTEATQTRTTNALDDLTREHGFVLEWRARAGGWVIRGLQQTFYADFLRVRSRSQ